MKTIRIYFLLLWVLCLLSACKIVLHRNLSEDEANEILSLLLINKIDAEKKIVKSGDIDLIVEKEQFSDAVEVLRQYGLPRAKTKTMQDIFPSGGLVSSPFEEQAKIAYLKEQQIQKMLNSLNGVIDAQVSVVQDINASKEETMLPSASIYIKYNAKENLADREASIRNLVLRSVPNLKPEAISIVMEAADIRYQRPLPSLSSNGEFSSMLKWLIGILLLSGIVTSSLAAVAYYFNFPWLKKIPLLQKLAR